MSLYNDKNLNYMEPSKTTLFTIPKGSLLYHGSLNKESFNPYDIRLGDDKLVSYFSPNKRLAADYIVGCALYPNKAGFLHKFRVKKDIEKILIISTHEKQAHWTLSCIDESFCSRKFRIQLDGIGFFFARRDEKDFTAIQQGEHLAKNFLNNNIWIPFIYYDKGALATIGKNKAVADLKGTHFKGFFAWFIWTTIHLMSISGFKNKLRVGLNWASSYFSYDKNNRLIIRKYKR